MIGFRNDGYVIERLYRWAIYCLWREALLTSSPKPRRVTSWLGRVIDGRLHDASKAPTPPTIQRPCPVDVIEAEETDRCVQALEERLRCVVVLEYLTDMGYEERVAAMRPPGAERTYYQRRDRAHHLLLGLMLDVAAGVPLTTMQVEPKIRVTLA